MYEEKLTTDTNGPGELRLCSTEHAEENVPLKTI